MASIKSFLDWVKGEDMEDDFDDFTPVQREEPIEEDAQQSTSSSYSAPSSAGSSRKGNVVNINATAQLAVVLVKPDRFDSVSEVADHLRDKKAVVLNLESTNKDVARRLVDFLSGCAYALDGKIKKVAISTYIITPYNVDIVGDLVEELENNSSMYF